jgi:peptidoglycan/xylan/chitin deacetylase (PgdA/CDA1 family)
MKIRVFLFHRVSPVRDPLWNPITPESFEKIIKYLKKNYEPVPLEKTLTSQFQPSGKKPLCAITFDDGYKDFIDYAFPILAKYNMPSSMYVVTDCVNQNIPPWTYIINHLFINTSKLSINLDLSMYPPSLQQREWLNKEERILYAKKLSPYLKKIDYNEKKLLYQQIKNDFNDVDVPEGLMMSWDDIKEIHSNGCEIGSHSCSHPLLANKTCIDEIRNELSESGKQIQEKIGKFPITISYPFGNYNDQVIRISKEEGYQMGVAVKSCTYNTQNHNIFEIPRIELYDEPYYKSWMRINGLIEKINSIIKVLLIIGLFV